MTLVDFAIVVICQLGAVVQYNSFLVLGRVKTSDQSPSRRSSLAGCLPLPSCERTFDPSPLADELRYLLTIRSE